MGIGGGKPTCLQQIGIGAIKRIMSLRGQLGPNREHPGGTGGNEKHHAPGKTHWHSKGEKYPISAKFPKQDIPPKRKPGGSDL